ncbi:Uncharacterized protein FWK35_00037306, partial [Aphis craccivora]
IKNFQQYLENWNKFQVPSEKGYYFQTDSTYYGLQISFKATIEVFDYLRFKYLKIFFNDEKFLRFQRSLCHILCLI